MMATDRHHTSRSRKPLGSIQGPTLVSLTRIGEVEAKGIHANSCQLIQFRAGRSLPLPPPPHGSLPGIVDRRQHLGGHARRSISFGLGILRLQHVLSSSFVISRCFVGRQRHLVRKISRTNDAVELTSSWQVVVNFKRHFFLRCDFFFKVVLDLIDISASVFHIVPFLVFLLLGRPCPIITYASHSSDCSWIKVALVRASPAKIVTHFPFQFFIFRVVVAEKGMATKYLSENNIIWG